MVWALCIVLSISTASLIWLCFHHPQIVRDALIYALPQNITPIESTDSPKTIIEERHYHHSFPLGLTDSDGDLIQEIDRPYREAQARAKRERLERLKNEDYGSWKNQYDLMIRFDSLSAVLGMPQINHLEHIDSSIINCGIFTPSEPQRHFR